MSSNTYDLKKLLEKYDVVVPVIQRDYAQGRKDKEYIRKTFLTEIKNYIDDNIPVALDFVYGNIEGNRFYPIDGQQRLTTLWLIHWYVSLKSGKLSGDKDFLSKFLYETRTSSSEFCKALCNEMPDKFTGPVVDYIKSQTWFYTSWLQDPTISSMLRTIGGDHVSKEDNIEAIFGNADFIEYRDRLFNQSIVNFELMVIGNEKLPISDDLYIKMNARGKVLTDFENFKADLVAWIQSHQNPDKAQYSRDDGTGKKTFRQYYPAQIDNAWMDVFWNSARKKDTSSFNGRIDEIYFSFINRYIVNKICLNEDLSPAEFAPEKEDEAHKKIKVGFEKLFGTGLRSSSADDSLVNYEGLDVYKPYLTFETINNLDYLFKMVSDNNILEAIENELKITDVDEETNLTGYSFIPYYASGANGRKLVSTSQKERVYFLAISLFIENCQSVPNLNFDKVKFSEWMRVIRNIVENAAIDNVPTMVTCMRLINKIATKLRMFDNEIYKVLNAYSDSLSNSPLDTQLKEEIDKSKKIMEDASWESKFEEAEKYSFFNGTIRFLYTSDTGFSWDDFDSKFNRAKKLFSDKVVSSNTTLAFLRHFSSFEEIKDKYLFTSIGYHPRNKCWKKDILCNEDMIKQVHALLMETAEPSRDDDYQSFITSGLVEKIITKAENYRFRYHWHYYWAIHKDYSQSEGVFVSLEHKAKCEALKRLVDSNTILLVDADFNSYHNGYYWGIKLPFIYNGSEYAWYNSYENGNRVDKIYKYRDGEESKYGMIWDNADDLPTFIDAFQAWN